VGTTRLGFVGVAAAVLTLAAAFFLDFPEGAAVDLGSGFGGQAISLMAVYIGCSGFSETV